MRLSEEEISAAINDGTIKSLTMDTSIFDGENNRFKHGLLVRLRQFKDTDVKIVLAEVIRREVIGHVARAAAEEQSKLKSALRGVGLAWQVAPELRDSILKSLFNGQTPASFAEQRVEKFLSDSGIEVISHAERVKVEDLVEDYFTTKAPFGKTADKKNEFPDAIALRALDHWAEETDCQVLVVSKDNDWSAYCATSPRLVCVKDLAAAIGHFQQSSSAICHKLSQLLRGGALETEVRYRLSAAVDTSDFIPEASSAYSFDYDVEEVEVGDVQFHEQDDGSALIVVERPEEDVIVVAADVEITYSVTTGFSFSIKDGIDKDMVPIGSTSQTANATVTARVLFTFEDIQAENPELAEIEVELSSRYHDVDYGDVSPSFERDWDDEWVEPEVSDQG